MTAFESLRQALSSAPCLALPNPDLPFVVHTDASGGCIGGVLMQDHGKGLQPIAFFSRKLNGAQQNYPVHEQELLALITALDLWRIYLLSSQRSIAYTDHKALTFFQNQKKLSPRQARWQAILQEFNLAVEYLPGKSNVVADALSRRPNTSEEVQLAEELAAIRSQLLHGYPISDPDGYSTDWITEIQQAYSSCKEASGILQCLRSGSPLSWRLEGGVIFHLHGRFKRLYIPSSSTFRQDILFEHHDAPLAGHLGMDKTFESIARFFYWPGLQTDVRHYVQTCAECVLNKTSSIKPAGLLYPHAIPTRKFQVVTMDLITALGLTARNVDSCLVVVDKLTKLITLIPLNIRSDSVEIAKLFRDLIICRFGVPKVVITDRDTRFTSQFSSALAKLLGIKQNLTTAFHPQTDGQTERTNRAVEDMLRCYSNTDQDWDLLLPTIEFAYNNSVNPSTGFSPFYLCYGQHAAPPALLRISSVLNEAAIDFHEKNVADLALARNRLAAANRRQAHYFNKKRRDLEFNLGDSVLLSTANFHFRTGRKLAPKWCGPWVIIHKISKVAYKLALPSYFGKMHPVFHISLLKPYHPDTRFTFTDANKVVSQELENWTPMPEYLLARRVALSGQVQYLVKWIGLPSYEATWEDRTRLLAFNNASLLQIMDLLDTQAALRAVEQQTAIAAPPNVQVAAPPVHLTTAPAPANVSSAPIPAPESDAAPLPSVVEEETNAAPAAAVVEPLAVRRKRAPPPTVQERHDRSNQRYELRSSTRLPNALKDD